MIAVSRHRELEQLPRPRGDRHNSIGARDLRARDLAVAGKDDPLLGRMLPRVSLPGLPSGPIDLHQRWGGTSVVLSSSPGVSSEFGGLQRHLARLRAWQRREPEFSSLGYALAFVCAQALDEQRAWVAGAGIDLTLLSDVELRLAASLRLPTVESQHGGPVYDELTLVLHGGEVGQVFYAARDPQNDPETVLRLLREVHG